MQNACSNTQKFTFFCFTYGRYSAVTQNISDFICKQVLVTYKNAQFLAVVIKDYIFRQASLWPALLFLSAVLLKVAGDRRRPTAISSFGLPGGRHVVACRHAVAGCGSRHVVADCGGKHVVLGTWCQARGGRHMVPGTWWQARGGSGCRLSQNIIYFSWSIPSNRYLILKNVKSLMVKSPQRSIYQSIQTKYTLVSTTAGCRTNNSKMYRNTRWTQQTEVHHADVTERHSSNVRDYFFYGICDLN